MDIFIIATIVLLAFSIWEQVRIIGLKRRLRTLEKYISKYDASVKDEAVK